MILSWALILGPTEPFWVLPCPTGVPRISKMYFWNILINIDNFYFHCHGQLSLYKYSKIPRCIFGIFSSILITFIFIVMVNSASKSFLPRTHAPTHPRTHAPTYPRTHAPTPGKLTYRGGTGPPKKPKNNLELDRIKSKNWRTHRKHITYVVLLHE